MCFVHFLTVCLQNSEAFDSVDDVIQGAQDIIAHQLSKTPRLRRVVRERFLKQGVLLAKKSKKASLSSKFKCYFDSVSSVQTLLRPSFSHRYLALQRGSQEGHLKLKLEGPPGNSGFEPSLIAEFKRAAIKASGSAAEPLLVKAAHAAYAHYVYPSVKDEIHKDLKAVANKAAVSVFSRNLESVLLASAFGPKPVIGLDPGIRTGCKTAVVDARGAHIDNAVLHFNSESARAKSMAYLQDAISTHRIAAIAIGNGTNGRETKAVLRKGFAKLGLETPLVMVNESGASIYSTSKVARCEFPLLDPTVRSAISIARRLQDPLAELVKLDPQSIGIGQYQKDVRQTDLKATLDDTVVSCVNKVGVDLNTAS